MNEFKVTKKTKTKVDQYKFLISLMCLMNNIKLSETNITVLAYLVHYGVSDETDQFIMDSGIFDDKQLLRNAKTRLFKKGFLKRGDMYKTYELNMPDKYKKLPETITVNVIIDNA